MTGRIERLEGSFQGVAFSAHRHDTYAIGVTLRGVQTFDYRGETRHSRRGQMVILHPDELHDGRAGTEAGFHYRTLYVKPADIQDVIGGKPLPFIKDGVSDDDRLFRILIPLLDDLETPLETDEVEDAVYDLASVLCDIARPNKSDRIVNLRGAKRAKERLDDAVELGVTLEELAEIAGQDRWQLSRDFRALYGTSPHRYLTQRRLDLARRRLAEGANLARVAFECGFADQSHFGRHFKKTYGLSPKAWLHSVGRMH